LRSRGHRFEFRRCKTSLVGQPTAFSSTSTIELLGHHEL
jgi:hypothetical protein